MKPLILITYRDRFTHLSCLKLHLAEYWNNYTLAVIEQDDKLSWNKGLLYNVGFKILSAGFDYIVLHDVDFIPVCGKVDYGYCDKPTMIAGEASQFDYKLYYPTFFGGVIVCNKEHYTTINGFSNQFTGYGGEDDLFRNSFIQKGIQPQVKMGRFECFAHPKPNIWPGSEFHKTPEYQHNLKLATAPRNFEEGLSTIEGMYTITDSHYEPNYIHIKVKTHERD